jgi:plastocyanin
MNNSNNQSMGKKSRKWLYALIAILILIILIGSVYYFETAQTPKAGSGTPLSIYVGEITTTAYGFGNSSSTLTSNPGPTITLTAGQIYTMTAYNIGSMQHNWAIVNAKSTSANVQWGAVTAPINAGASGEVTFRAGQAGSYFYICQVPGHVALGLWGTVIVTS